MTAGTMTHHPRELPDTQGGRVQTAAAAVVTHLRARPDPWRRELELDSPVKLCVVHVVDFYDDAKYRGIT